MGYSVIPLFFKNGTFYFSGPGIKIYCTRDDHGVYRYSDFIFEPKHYNSTLKMERSEAIHYYK